ncbi:class I SAM-dependent methyltransferase [Bradyrhizobium sp. B120]|uniref:class I SAM-dependent methyltransferase n=1 Tax=Bradyrhizobium sp. B120 TaxID=3410088 RepID=UPI003B980D62
MQFLDQVTSSYCEPILDAPCGFGRNALALAARGYDVVAVDKDLDCLDSLKNTAAIKLDGPKWIRSGKVFPVCADLKPSRLPFGESSFSAIVCVHYPVQEIISDLCTALKDGGWLYIETFGGQGQNYLELPRAGAIRRALEGHKLVYYKERPVGPTHQEAVAVCALSQKSNRPQGFDQS